MPSGALGGCLVVGEGRRSEAEAGEWTSFFRCLGARFKTVPTNGFAPRIVPGSPVDAQQNAPHRVCDVCRLSEGPRFRLDHPPPQEAV